MTDNDLREHLGRLLERTEEQGRQLERILANGEARDVRMQQNLVAQTKALEDAKHSITEELSLRVRDAVHDQRNDAQITVNKIVLRLDEVDRNVKAIDGRVDRLEVPMRRALAIRLRRRRVLVKIVSIASFVGAASWVLVEPLWKAIGEPIGKAIAKKFFHVDLGQ